MKHIVLIFILMFGCGANGHGIGIGFKDPELKMYEDMFLRDAIMLGRVPISTTRMYFKDLSGSQPELLAYASFPSREIVVNSALWGSLSIREKKWLMYHELIHAACFFMSHEDDTIMNPSLEAGKISKMTNKQFGEYLWAGIKRFCIIGINVDK